jgi:glucosamine-6-phosphate deaminase
MRITIGSDPTRLIEQAADAVEALVRATPDAVLGIATGSTPEPLYAELTSRAQRGLDLSRLRVTCLDEYVSADHPQSYRHYIRTHVLEPWGIDPATTVLPAGDAADPDAAALDFEHRIRDWGGVDLQILGVGPNGHIAFNEPGSPFDSRTRTVELTASTRQANARFFEHPDEVPTRAISQGIGTILESRHALLLAFGEGKAPAIGALVEGASTPEVPVSALQRHADVDVYVDDAAASHLHD